MTTFAGIDVGKRKHFCCALNTGTRTIEFANQALDHAATLAWIQNRKPSAVCIDGPPLPNNGSLRRRLPANTLRNTERRVAEFQLGIGGCYSTPGARPAANASNAWMGSGMDLYQDLAQQNRWAIDLGAGTGQLLETHPTYAFKSLLGRTSYQDEGLTRHNVDPRRLLRPKASSAGHAQRVDLLKRALEQLQVTVTPAIIQMWNSRIDWVDTTICSLVAYWRSMDLATQVGDADEGSIYLYVPDKPLQIEPLEPDTTPRDNVGGGRPNAIILRLGEGSFGTLDQQDTLDILEQAADDGECWLPIGSKTSFRLCENLWTVRGRLFLAFGSTLCAEVTTGDCCVDDNRPIDYPGTLNPWPINQCHRWVKLLDARAVRITRFHVRAGDEWREGFGRGQRALLWGRV